MAPTPIVLLCGVPGTRLSAIAAGLEKQETESKGPVAGESAEGVTPTTKVSDLEERIVDYYRTRDNGPDSYSMFEVVVKPRQELYETWTTKYRETLADISSEPASVHIVCMHLTWYHSSWKEFYSPVDILSLNDDNFQVSHIIVLIDDIYDMLVRLQDENHLYDDATMLPTRNLIGKLSELPHGSPRPFIDFFKSRLFNNSSSQQKAVVQAQRVRVQSVELALGELLAWRRTEMMYAESIARSLNCKLTLLGTKHSQASIELLATDPNVPRIYLSHRISEPRRAINSYKSRSNSVHDWSPVAAEVNKLHDILCERGLLLINPTAIDELRFENNRRTKRRSPRLTRRWPLPASDLISPPAVDDIDHSEVLLRGLPHDDEVASHAARSLSIQITSDVAFRDHFIVENTPNLCVFRPFHCETILQPESKPEWSRGVEAELSHWRRCNQHQLTEDGQGPYRRRKIAFVHTRAEIGSRLRLVAIDDSRRFKQHIINHTPGVSAALVHKEVGSSALDTSQGTQDVLSDPGGFKTSLQSAALTACHFAFTHVLREEPPENILLVAVDESSDGRIDGINDLATLLKRFFDDQSESVDHSHDEGGEDEVTSQNTDFLDECSRIFEEVVGKDLLLYALQAVGKDDTRTRNLLDL